MNSKEFGRGQPAVSGHRGVVPAATDRTLKTPCKKGDGAAQRKVKTSGLKSVKTLNT